MKTDDEARAKADAAEPHRATKQGKTRGNAHNPGGQQSAPKSGKAPPELIMLVDCELSTEPYWSIDDTLPRCSMMMGFGPGGCGKTYLMTSVALGIGSGQWFDRTAEKGAVLICAFERPEDAEDRFAALRDQYRYQGLPIALLKLGGMALDRDCANLIIQRAKELAERTGLPVRMIVVDTVRAALGPKAENDEGLGLLRILGEDIHALTGAMIAWLHHEGKSEGFGPRGILTLADACSVWWRVEQHENGARIIHVEKGNRGPTHIALLAFKLIPFEAGRDVKDKPIVLCKLEMTDLEEAKASPVLQRFGKPYRAAAAPEAKAGERGQLFMKELRKLYHRHPGGVPRDLHMSSWLLAVNSHYETAGKATRLAGTEGMSAYRKTLYRCKERDWLSVSETEPPILVPTDD